jgi:hypothetical protein
MNLESQITLTRLEQQALRALDAMGGLATAEAISVILDKYRTHTSLTLKALEMKGILRGVEAQLVPGRDKGRPMRVYMRSRNEISGVWEKIKGLIRSRMITEMVAVGYKFTRYERANDEIEFKDSNHSGKAPIIAVIDDPGEPVEHLAERMTAVRARCQWSLAALQSPERAAILRHTLKEGTEPILICVVVNGCGREHQMVSEEDQKTIARIVSKTR